MLHLCYRFGDFSLGADTWTTKRGQYTPADIYVLPLREGSRTKNRHGLDFPNHLA